MSADYMKRLGLDAAEIASRREFFEITDEDLALLASLRASAEAQSVAIVDALYELILAHPESRNFFPDTSTLQRVKALQRKYFLGLFSGVLDAAYVEDRLRVGTAHERIGLAPKWYIGAYSRYLRILLGRLFSEMPSEQAQAAHLAATKLVMFDMTLALDTYIAAQLESVRRHQQALRELSTPVIRVHARILLLPLIGTVDSHRAEQIMETLLTRVVDEQARAVIIDIAGVPVVDTGVADHLIRTTAAVRLLGAETILTGISAQFARVLVQLGVDISSMHTRTRLDEGIELALAGLGRTISEAKVGA